MRNADVIFVEKHGHILCVVYMEELTLTSVVEEPVIYLLPLFFLLTLFDSNKVVQQNLHVFVNDEHAHQCQENI